MIPKACFRGRKGIFKGICKNWYVQVLLVLKHAFDFIKLNRFKDYTNDVKTGLFSSQLNPANICWSSIRLQRNNFTSFKTSWRHLARHLEDVSEDEKLLRWRRLKDMSWRRLQEVLETNKMFTGDTCI